MTEKLNLIVTSGGVPLDQAEGVRLFKEQCRRAAIANKAIGDILAERSRQISAEGWTIEHDDQHVNGELARAAAVYALASTIAEPREGAEALSFWPWDLDWLKTDDERRCLVKAGALILAEIERIDRAERRA